jgi:nucleoside-diphosphate-sugar epimerase
VRVLFVGGTGNLSRDCTLRALDAGMELVHLNRGSRPESAPPGLETLLADIRDEEAASRVLAGRSFDAVVDFIAYTADDVARSLRLFSGRAGQYVFVSSASVYRKPPLHHLITEETPLGNPFWRYARDKIAGEELLRREGRDSVPAWTIVRPSHTYAEGWIPLPLGSRDFTQARRLIDGREIILPDGGQSLWTLTHARDFAVGLVGLLGNSAAYGESVQVTGEEALTWEEIAREVAEALGVEPRLARVPTELIAAVDPEFGAGLLGDKAWSSRFDCAKLKRLVPGFRATLPFRDGIRASVEWFLADPRRQVVNQGIEARMERVLRAWRSALAAAAESSPD